MSIIKKLFIILLLSGSAFAQSATGIIPANRYADWTQAGVQGGIPTNWTQCGPTLTSSASAATIKAAVNHTGVGYTGCTSNTYVQLAAGTFNLTTGICWQNVNGSELRGMGADTTKLVFSGIVNCQGGGANVALGFEDTNGEYLNGFSSAVQWTSGFAQGANQITVSSGSALGITLNKTMIMVDQCDTGFSGNTTAAPSGPTPNTCSSGSSIDNGGFFDAGAPYVPSANDSSTATVSGGVNVSGSGFNSAFGNILNLDDVSYLVSSFNSSASITLSSLTPAPNGSHAAAFPTGNSYNSSNGGAGRPRRFQEEWFLVTACSPSCANAGSTVLTLSSPLIHPNWVSGQSPEVVSIQGNNFVGIRDLTVDLTGVNSSPHNIGIDFNNISNFWVKGVEVKNAQTQGIGLYDVAYYEIQSSYIYDAGQNVGGTDPNPNDPSGIDWSGSFGLIDNNIIQWSRIGIIGNSAGSGNVISYNFMVNCFESNGDLWGCLWDKHQNGTDFNLFEGNVAPQVYMDQTHGGGLSETYNRNFITGWESCSNGNCSPSAPQKNANVYAIGDLSSNRYENFVGNILGTPGITTNAYVYTNTSQFVSNTTGYVYNWASGNASPGTGGPLPIDPIVLLSSFRWENWDAINNATLACTAAGTPIAACTGDERSINAPTYPGLTSPSTSLPASFYLSSRPSWWSISIPFPAIGPDVSSGNVGQCGGTVNTAGQYALVPATNASQCATKGLNTAWAGHVNAIPAMACFLSVMGGAPDGTGSASTFNESTCFGNQVVIPPNAPTKLMISHVSVNTPPSPQLNNGY